MQYPFRDQSSTGSLFTQGIFAPPDDKNFQFRVWYFRRREYNNAVGRIPEETVEQVLAASDIVDVIGSYLPLKRAGSNFKANCPFHNEKTPSFMVNPARQSYHCFGCGEGGSAIGFLMAYENLPFVDAVKKLADRSGVLIQEEAYDPEADKRRRMHSRLKELHNGAARFMHDMLMKSPQSKHARDYLNSRGYGQEMAKRWLVGWMPEQPSAFLDWARANNFTGKELCASGIAAPKDRGGLYLRFRDRLMFPIHNDYGDIIAFSGRQLKEDPNSGKYINSPETALFKKSKVFFALDKARRSMAKDKCALLCEGQIDVIACHEAGITNAVATQGTACTPEHARLLKRYTKDAVLCFDSDNAGVAAADKAFAVMSAEGIHVRMVALPEGEDPDSLIKKQGADNFRDLVQNARDYFDVKIEHETNNRDLSSTRERVSLANDLAALVAHVGDKMTKDALIHQIATRLGIGSEELRGGVVRAEKQKSRTQFYDTRQKAREDQDTERAPKPLPTPINSSISYLCHLALTSREAQDWLGEQLESLIDPLDSLAGGSILRTILGRCPDPESPAATQTFIQSLPEEDQLALRAQLASDTPENPRHAAEETTAMLVSIHYQNKEATIRARLREPDLGANEMVALMNQAKELQDILKNLQQRFIR